MRYCLLIVLLIECLPAGAARGGQEMDVKTAKVKAAFVLNFIKFTQWPENSFEQDDSPIVVTVLGEDELAPYLRSTLTSAMANRRPLQVRNVAYPTAVNDDASVEERQAYEAAVSELHALLAGSHVLYVCESESHRLPGVFKAVGGKPVLTIAGIEGFASRGGMLGLTTRRSRVTFEANPRAVKDGGMTLSSKLLKLAIIIKESRREDT